MSVIKRSVQRNGKTYLQVKALNIPLESKDRYERHNLKEAECFMCVNNSRLGNECEQYNLNDPPCNATKDLIFISEHSLKRYLKMAVIQRMG